MSAHAQRDSNIALWGSIVNYDCDEGFKFSDESTRFTIECLDAEQWNATVPDCHGLCDVICSQNSKILSINKRQASQLLTYKYVLITIDFRDSLPNGADLFKCCSESK